MKCSSVAEETCQLGQLCFTTVYLTYLMLSIEEVKGCKKGSSCHSVHHLQRGQVHRCSHEGNGKVCLCASARIAVDTPRLY